MGRARWAVLGTLWAVSCFDGTPRTVDGNGNGHGDQSLGPLPENTVFAPVVSSGVTASDTVRVSLTVEARAPLGRVTGDGIQVTLAIPGQ